AVGPLAGAGRRGGAAAVGAGGPGVGVFFSASHMTRRVLAEVDLAPAEWRSARLAGFDIAIAPRANLVRAPSATVYGVLATATHRELERLYAHARDVLGERYLPEAVLAESLAGAHVPALCSIAHDGGEQPADPVYVERILAPARELGFPAEYLARLESFRERGPRE